MKYMGSKNRFAKDLVPIFMGTRDNWYVEPFAGGMNIIDKVQGKRIANDINRYLIEMWKALVSGWIPEYVDEDLYADIRDNKKNFKPSLVGWVGFNCSYSGKYFGGFAGKTDTLDGMRNYQAEALKSVLSQVTLLQFVRFENSSYYDLNIPSNSIVYCDPPYRGTTGYGVDFDSDVFFQWVRTLTREGNSVFVSEYEAPDDFKCVWEKETNISLSANLSRVSHNRATEKLFVYKG